MMKGVGEGRELWGQLSDALPARTTISIIKFCRRKFNNFPERGKWTEEQEEELKIVFEKYPKRWKQLGELLNRHPEDIRDRWRNYVVCGDQLKKSYWTFDEEKDLKTIVHGLFKRLKEEGMEHPGAASSINDGGMFNEYSNIDWQLVSEKMGRTRSRLQCITKWKSICARESDQAADNENLDNADLDLNGKSWRIEAAKLAYFKMTRAEKQTLLFAIRESQAGREGKIPWKYLSDENFRSRWPVMARKVAWKKMRATIRNNLQMPLQEIVDALIHKLGALDEEGHTSQSSQSSQPRDVAKPKVTKSPKTATASQTPKRRDAPKVPKVKLSTLSDERVIFDSEEDAKIVAPRQKTKKAKQIKPVLSEEMVISDDEDEDEVADLIKESVENGLGKEAEVDEKIDDENGEEIEAEINDGLANEDVSLNNSQISDKYPQFSQYFSQDDDSNEEIIPLPYRGGNAKPDIYDDSEHGSFDIEAARAKAVAEGYHGIEDVDEELQEYWRDRKSRLNVFLEAMVRPGGGEIDLDKATEIFNQKYDDRWPKPTPKSSQALPSEPLNGADEVMQNRVAEGITRRKDVVNWATKHSQERSSADDSGAPESTDLDEVSLYADGKPVKTLADMLRSPGKPKAPTSKRPPPFAWEPSPTESESGDDDMSDIPARIRGDSSE
jgi:hypothetical protein